MAKHPTAESKMVLRTVYLPIELDRRLRGIAFREERSKGDLMRDLIGEALARRREAGETTFEERAPVRISKASGTEVRDELPSQPVKAKTSKPAAAKKLVKSRVRSQSRKAAKPRQQRAAG